MSEINYPSVFDIIFSDMERDSEKISPDSHICGKAFCCLCGRRLDKSKFSIEHIIPQQFLNNDKNEYRTRHPKNKRTPLILLCEEKLNANGRNYRGCNGFKGSVYDSHIAKFLASSDNGKFQDGADNSASNSGSHINEIIGLMLIMFFALYKKFGYRVVFSEDGRILRKQFLTPGILSQKIPDYFWTPTIVDCNRFKDTFVKDTLSDPFHIVDPEIFNGKEFHIDGEPVNISDTFSHYFVLFRNIVMRVPIRYPLPKYINKQLIVPERYRIKPNFGTILEQN